MNTPSFPSVQADALYLILGLGETGAAAARWCAGHGGRLRVVDTREQSPGWDTLQGELGDAIVGATFGAEAVSTAILDDVHAIVISPGLSPYQEPFKSLLDNARLREIEILGEIELFARALHDLAEQGHPARVLAVTGTNGKTTVTAMTQQLVDACGLSVRAAGNISPAALAALTDALAEQQLPDVWVLELSSFQLETTRSLRPDAAVVLNLTQDHLDWHGSMEGYGQAKARLLQMSGLAIVNRDDPAVMQMVQDAASLHVRSFGRDAPSLVGDLGLDNSHGVAWLCASENSDFELPAGNAKRRKQAAEPVRETGRLSRLMPVDALRVRGMHNALNALAALALGRALGMGWANMLRALRDFSGGANRVEFVRAIADVDFVNDSKGTNVGATIAALEGLGQSTVLIAGGLGKGQDFAPLALSVRRHARAVVLIGQDAALIGQALTTTGVPVEYAESLERAVELGFGLAQPGDVVLLSPACASMDMFKNYAHRGQVFVDAVNALALDRGEMA